MKPEVETVHGRIRGVEDSGIRIFRGVRFASPPAGRRRFLPPAAPKPWKRTRNAIQMAPAAPQFTLPWLSWLNAAGSRIDEDCLFLNVWTPGLDSAKRPVMVWIHGGGFLIGSGFEESSNLGVRDQIAAPPRGFRRRTPGAERGRGSPCFDSGALIVPGARDLK